MIFPTAGYCLSVRYHSLIWFLLVVMSPRTKTNSGKNWVATGHWATTCNVQNLDELCLHYGTLWCTLQLTNCSICSLWRPVKNVHKAECTFTNPKTPDIWSSELNSIITELVRVHLLPSTSPPNRRLPTIYYITTFSTYITTSTTATTTSTHLPSSTYFLQQLVLLPLPPALLPNKAQNYPGFTTVTHSSLPGGCKFYDDASHACLSFNSLSITTTSACVIALKKYFSNGFPKGMWEFFSGYKPFLGHLVCTILSIMISIRIQNTI